jgi:hypothetical protein
LCPCAFENEDKGLYLEKYSSTCAASKSQTQYFIVATSKKSRANWFKRFQKQIVPNSPRPKLHHQIVRRQAAFDNSKENLDRMQVCFRQRNIAQPTTTQNQHDVAKATSKPRTSNIFRRQFGTVAENISAKR